MLGFFAQRVQKGVFLHKGTKSFAAKTQSRFLPATYRNSDLPISELNLGPQLGSSVLNRISVAERSQLDGWIETD